MREAASRPESRLRTANAERTAAFRSLAERNLDPSYPEDAVHDAFITAWRKWVSLHDPAKFDGTPVAFDGAIWAPSGEGTVTRIATEVTRDLLPGVDLVTEQVEPGVFRVVSDGLRDLSKPVVFNQVGGVARNLVVAAPDGSVWIFGPEELFRLGDRDAHANARMYWGDVVDVDGDGHVWALGGHMETEMVDGCLISRPVETVCSQREAGSLFRPVI